jgi:plasmid stability protein
MADVLYIADVPEWVRERLAERAKRNRRSVTQEVIHILEWVLTHEAVPGDPR